MRVRSAGLTRMQPGVLSCIFTWSPYSKLFGAEGGFVVLVKVCTGMNYGK